MGRTALLDKGVLLGFCFTVEHHHPKCREYLSAGDRTYYLTKDIEAVYHENRERILGNHAESIRKHVAFLRGMGYDTELTESDLEELRSWVVDENLESRRYLSDRYSQFPDGITVGEVVSILEDLEWDIEQAVIDKKSTFDEKILGWVRYDSYDGEEDGEDIQADLPSVSGEDLEVCLDGHDVARFTDRETELATTDIDDIYDNRDEIEEATEIDAVIDVAVQEESLPREVS